MKPHNHIITSNFNPSPPPHPLIRRRLPSFTRLLSLSLHPHNKPHDAHRRSSAASRRAVLLTPFLAAAGSFLLQQSQSLAEEITPPSPPVTSPQPKVVVEEALVSARIYDATAIGEPLAVGKDKSKVWEKLMNARIVYLGEAEQVPIRDDKELELEIVKNLKKRCVENQRPLALALEAFPSDLQNQLDQFMAKRLLSIALTSLSKYINEFSSLSKLVLHAFIIVYTLNICLIQQSYSDKCLHADFM